MYQLVIKGGQSAKSVSFNGATLYPGKFFFYSLYLKLLMSKKEIQTKLAGGN